MYRTKLKVMGEVSMEEGASSQLRNSTLVLSMYSTHVLCMYVYVPPELKVASLPV